MTDAPDDLDASLAALEATQKRSHRIFRRAVLTNVGALLALASLSATLVLLGAASHTHDLWLYRNLITIGGLTTLGLLGHLSAVRAYQIVVERDALLLEQTRKRVELSRALDELRDQMRPLVDAMREAHAHGVAVVIQPVGIAPPKLPVLN